MRFIYIIMVFNLYFTDCFNEITVKIIKKKNTVSNSIDKTVKYLTDINYGNASNININNAYVYVNTLMHPNMNVLDIILRSKTSASICRNLEQNPRKVLYLLHHNKYTEEQIAIFLNLSVEQINTILYNSHNQILFDLKMQILDKII